MCKIILTFAGVDGWDRVVFKGDNGRFYKTADFLEPDCGFLNAPHEEQERIFGNLHTSEPYDDFEGEPGWPVTLEKFILANS